MVEKVQLTLLIFFGLSWLFVSNTRAEDISDPIKFIVLGVLFGSAIGVVALTLIRIWS